MKKLTFLLLFIFCFKYYSIAITLNANPTSNNGTGGIFMQLTTNANPLTITSFNTQYGSVSGSSVMVQIYSRSGAYAGFTGSSAGWTLLGTVTTVSAGTATTAPMDVTSLNINLPASTTTSFYLHSITAGGGIRYFGTGTVSMTNFSDANVALFTDVARTGAVAFGGSAFSPRALTGSIDYVISGPPDPCSPTTTINCGESTTIATTGAGVWSPGNCGFTTPGQEKVYSFTPTVSGTYILQITAATGGFADYFYKLASAGCGPTGWTCIGDASGPESNNFGPLTAGVTYLILFDSEVTSAASQTFQVNCLAADPCLSITTISCGTPITASTTGTGAWSPLNCGFSTPGQEKVYSFTPTITGTYGLQITAASGGFADYFFKLASGGCSATGWTCIGDANAPETNNFGPLTAGVTYYILFDSEVTGAASQTFQINCLAGDPCSSIPTLLCGVATTVSTTGAGLWSPGNCGFSTPGQEKLFSFTPTASGMHTLQVTSGNGILWGDYFYKAASGGCSATGWTCIDDFSLPGSITFGPLTSGTTYYILYDSETTAFNSQTFNINCLCTFVPTLVVTENSGTPNNGTICQGASATVTANGGGTYLWSTGATTAAITVSPASTTIYTVTITAPNSCVYIASSTVTVSPLPAASATAMPNPVCSGNTLYLNANGGSSYAWSGPGGFTSAAKNPAILNILTSQAGTYTVTVTNIAGCSATASVNVVVNQTPSGSATATPSTVCVGTPVQLNSTGGGTYSWTGPLGYTSNQQNPIINITSYQQAGTYFVTVTGAGGCSNIYKTEIKVFFPPIATASHTQGTACTGSTLQLLGSGAGSYSWSGPGGFTSTLQNPTRPNATAAYSGVYTLVVTSPNGCTATATTTVSIVAPPVVTASVEDNSVCEGSSVFLHSSGASSYTWAGPYGYSSSYQHPVISNIPVYLSGIYTVTGTGPTGCTANATVLVNVYSGISGSASATPNPAFVGQNVQFTATGGSSYLWTGPNGFGSTDQNPLLYNAGSKAAGIYTVIITNEGGCQTTIHVTLTFVTPKQGVNEGYFDITSTKPIQGYVFPNPANSIVTLERAENSSIMYSVMDANGKVMFRNQVSSDGQIRVESLTPGIYNVIWTEQGEKGATYYGKFVKVD